MDYSLKCIELYNKITGYKGFQLSDLPRSIFNLVFGFNPDWLDPIQTNQLKKVLKTNPLVLYNFSEKEVFKAS